MRSSSDIQLRMVCSFYAAACAPSSRSSITRRAAGGSSAPFSAFCSVGFCRSRPRSRCWPTRPSSCCLVDAGDRAPGDAQQLLVDLALRRLGDLDRGVEQLAVEMNAAVVDRRVENPMRLFFGRQEADAVIQRALGGNILLA